jgi:hypothetical protein
VIIETVWVIRNKKSGNIFYGVGRTRADAWRNAILLAYDTDMSDVARYKTYQRNLQAGGWRGERVNVVAMPEAQ